MKLISKPLALAMASVFLLNSCANMPSSINQIGAQYGTAIGCGAGAVIGGVIGAQFDSGRGTLLGAAIGSAIGCYAGHKWQKRMIALQEFSAKEGQVLDVETVVKPDPEAQGQAAEGSSQNLAQVGFSTQISSVAMFDVGQSKLTKDGELLVGRLIDVLLKTQAEGEASLNERKFLVVGHTDSSGGSELNQALSEKRAKEVGKVLLRQGVKASNIYYQGAGSSRPLVDNSTASGMVRNRRVEIVELNDEEALVIRIAQESSAIRYARHSTKASEGVELPKVSTQAAGKIKPPVELAKAQIDEPPSPVVEQDTKAKIDFKGVLVKATGVPNIGSKFEAKRAGFSIISDAKADGVNVKSCLDDSPRVSGDVKSLVNDKPFNSKAKTLDYVPGFNGTVWGNTVNGHLVWVYPVSVLKDGFVVNQHPVIEVVNDYKAGNRKPMPKVKSFANVFEGEKEFLYRTYFDAKNEGDLVCMDLLFDRREVKTTAGFLYYKDGSKEVRYAQYSPLRQH